MTSVQATMVALGALVFVGGGAILFLDTTVTLGDQQLGCRSVVQAWMEPPTTPANPLQEAHQNLCEQRRSANLGLGGFIATAGAAMAVAGWVWFGRVAAPPQAARGGHSEPRPAPQDQRPPAGYWWDGEKWNPPAG